MQPILTALAEGPEREHQDGISNWGSDSEHLACVVRASPPVSRDPFDPRSSLLFKS
jgi:hypothetical protein